MGDKKTLLFGFHKAKEPNSPFYNRLISWWTNGPYCHVEIFYKDYDDYLKKFSSSPEDGYVRTKKTELYIRGYDFIPFEVTEEQFKIFKTYERELKCGKYDWPGILGFIIPTKDRSDQWFCSETTSNYLKIIGYKHMWKVEPSEVSPNRLARILNKGGYKTYGLECTNFKEEDIRAILLNMLDKPIETKDPDYDKSTFWDLFKRKKKKKCRKDS